jgi:hypothetical protein
MPNPNTDTLIGLMSALLSTAGRTMEDQRVLAGAGFSVSTSVVAVAAGSDLNAILSNPAGSGVNLLMTSRILASNMANGATVAEYIRYASGATMPAGTPTVVTPGNRLSGGPTTGARLSWLMAANPLVGTATSSGFIPSGGARLELKESVIIAPGMSLCYSIGGAGGGLAAASRLAMTFLFTQEPI